MHITFSEYIKNNQNKLPTKLLIIGAILFLSRRLMSHNGYSTLIASNIELLAIAFGLVGFTMVYFARRNLLADYKELCSENGELFTLSFSEKTIAFSNVILIGLLALWLLGSLVDKF